MTKQNKKGQVLGVQGLPALAITFAVVVIIVGLMASVLTTVRDNSCGVTGRTTCTGNVTLDVQGFAYNATNFGLSGLDTFGDYLPTVALVLVASVIIGLILVYLAFRGRSD